MLTVRVMRRTMGVMTQTPTAEVGLTGSLSGRVTTRVRMLMAARRKSVKELAAVLHLSERAAQRRNAGEYPYSLGELETVGAWLGVDPETFLTGRGLDAA